MAGSEPRPRRPFPDVTGPVRVGDRPGRGIIAFVLYTLGALVLALAGLVLVRRRHQRLLAISACLVPLGYLIAGLGLFVKGGGALGMLYLGVLIVLLGLVGVVVFGVGTLRARRDEQSGDLLPPI